MSTVGKVEEMLRGALLSCPTDGDQCKQDDGASKAYAAFLGTHGIEVHTCVHSWKKPCWSGAACCLIPGLQNRNDNQLG